MSPSVFQTNPKQRSRFWILLAYVWFAVFGFGAHHWAGSHQHTHGSMPESSESQSSDCQHHCCHESHSNENSSLASDDGRPSIDAKSSPCEGCQLWWSIAQASQSFEPIESIESLMLCDSTIEQTSPLFGALVVAWHSRGPPAL